MHKNTHEEQELLSRLITQDAYSWQEFYRHYQNEDYGDAIQKIYRYVSDGARKPTLANWKGVQTKFRVDF